MVGKRHPDSILAYITAALTNIAHSEVSLGKYLIPVDGHPFPGPCVPVKSGLIGIKSPV